MLLKFKDRAYMVRFIDSQKKYIMVDQSVTDRFSIITKKGKKYSNTLDKYITVRIFPTHVKNVYKCEELGGYMLHLDRFGKSGELVAPTYKAERMSNDEIAIIQKAKEMLEQGMKFSAVQKWAYEQRSELQIGG